MVQASYVLSNSTRIWKEKELCQIATLIWVYLCLGGRTIVGVDFEILQCLYIYILFVVYSFRYFFCFTSFIFFSQPDLMPFLPSCPDFKYVSFSTSLFCLRL